MILTPELLHDAGVKGVGFNRDQLELLGVRWPPPRGWLKALEDREISDETWATVLKLKGVRKRHRRAAIINGTIHAGAFLFSVFLIAGCKVEGEPETLPTSHGPFVIESAQDIVTPIGFNNFQVVILNDTNANARYLVVIANGGTAVTPMQKPQ